VYEVFDHTADLGLRILAPDLTGLFEEAVPALFSIIVANPETIRPVQEDVITVAGADVPMLFFDWLGELLHRFETRTLLLCRADVHTSDDRIEATVFGEVFDPARHRLDHEVKAVTYHQLRVEQQSSGWLAEVILDI
jgi:SHS2 domain-containing protein